MKSGWRFALAIAAFFLVPAWAAVAQEIKLGTNCVISFASVEAARNILTRRDEFIAALSPFDRAARMKTNREVSEKEFLEFAEQQARAWTPEEMQRVTEAWQNLQPRLAPWALPLPPAIPLVKTSGMEEGQACYTRQNAIVLAQRYLRTGGRRLEDLLAHELFHVISRHDPALRARLYRIIGFTPITEVEYPAELRALKITNPDGVPSGWAITVTNGNQALAAVPVLHASTPRYDPAKGGEFFNYLEFKLMAVAKKGDLWEPLLEDGRPRLFDPQEADGFFDLVGRNTDYIIHPDEILADNFVQMINGKSQQPTPRIGEAMQSVLRKRTAP